MHIRYIKIKGFRGISVFEATMKNNMMTIVGKNDVGKSTVLRAIRIFFEDISFELEDFNKHTAENITEIEVHFDEVGLDYLKDDGFIKVKKSYTVDEKGKIVGNVYVWEGIICPQEDELEEYKNLKKFGTQIGVEFPTKKPAQIEEIDLLKMKVKKKVELIKESKKWNEDKETWKDMKLRLPELIFIPAVASEGFTFTIVPGN